MARQLTPTPTLEGKDVENFYRELDRTPTRQEQEQRRKFFQEANSIFKKYGKKIIQKMLN